MSAKQDRQGVRTAAQLEQKWKFGDSFAEVYGIATDAQRSASEAEQAAKNPAANLSPDEVFGLLTNNGASKGIYRDENGEIYINASYLKTGVIKGITLESEDGNIRIDLSSGQPVFNTSISTKGITVRTDAGDEEEVPLMTVGLESHGVYDAPCIRFYDSSRNVLLNITEDDSRAGSVMSLKDDTGDMATEIMSTNEQTGITFMYAGCEPHGYLRMSSDSHIRLKCDVVNCKQINDGNGPKKIAWIGPDEQGVYQLVGFDPDDDDFFDPSAGIEPYTRR